MESQLQTPKAVQTALRKVPTLSLNDFTEGSSLAQEKFTQDLFQGLKEYGFVILKNHGVSEELLRGAYQVSEKFFSLSTEEKRKYISASGGQRGYTPFGQEHAKDSPVMDLKEFWHVGRQVHPAHPDRSFHPDNLWPMEVPEFQPLFQKLYDDLETAGRIMLQALTGPLDLDIEYFERMVIDGSSILRLLHYPPIPEGIDPRCVRAAAHEDINLITLLPAATSSGLQLKDRDGQWLDVDSDWGDLIVDAGDMLARITNDIIPATTHRVINPNNTENKSRFSMPFFMHPAPTAWLSVIPSCRGAGAKYPDVTAHDALVERLKAIGLLK
jgi:isopenicillin N synthase-like dioxygenase